MPKSTKRAEKKGVVSRVVDGATSRVEGVVQGVFTTLGKVVNRAGKVTSGTVRVAGDILTLDGKKLRKDVRGIGRSTVGAVTNVAKGTVSTARAAVVGKEVPAKKSAKKSSSKKSTKA